MKRQLSRQAFFKICEWLRNNAEQVLAQRPTWTALARQAGQAIGMELRGDWVQEAAACCQLSWECAANVGGAAQSKLSRRMHEVENRLAAVEVALAKIEARTDHVAKITQEWVLWAGGNKKALEGLRGMVSHLYEELSIQPLKEQPRGG